MLLQLLRVPYDGFMFICFQENDSKRARAVKKANDERELKKQKDKEIDRLIDFTI